MSVDRVDRLVYAGRHVEVADRPGVLAAVVLLWNRAVDGIDLGIMAAMYLTTAVGVTVGADVFLRVAALGVGYVAIYLLIGYLLFVWKEL